MSSRPCKLHGFQSFAMQPGIHLEITPNRSEIIHRRFWLDYSYRSIANTPSTGKEIHYRVHLGLHLFQVIFEKYVDNVYRFFFQV